MKITVLGTGGVGRTIAGKLAELGHEVRIGTRDRARTLERSEPDRMGTPPYSAWAKEKPAVTLVAFKEAVADADFVFNCTHGAASIDALKACGDGSLDGRIVIDLANPLDFSKGMPPTLFVCNDDSLAERIQKALPKARVVKTLNTVTASLMVNPGQLAGGDHSLFVSGDDREAKESVTAFLKNEFGWKSVIDLGDVTTARGTEMVLPLWLRLYGAFGSPMFNYKIQR